MKTELLGDMSSDYQPNRRVLELLRRVGDRPQLAQASPSLVEIYESMFRVANDRQNKDRFSSVGHSIRELMALAVRNERERDGRAPLKVVQDAITALGWDASALEQKTAKELMGVLLEVLDRKALREKLTTDFGFSESLAAAWIEFNNETVLGYAHHGGGSPPTETDMRTLLERANLIFLQTFGQIVEHTHAVDRLIELGPPKAEDYGKFKQELKHIFASPALCGYFLGKLQDAAWIPTLHRAGFFKPAGGTALSGNGENASSDLWPSWRFLAKVAGSADGRQVAEIVNQAKTLPNPAVVSECLDVLLKIPPTNSASCAKTLAGWLASNREPDWLAKKVGDLLKRWMESGQKDAVFATLTAVFKPRRAKKLSRGSPKVEGALSGFWFQQLIIKVLPSVQAKWPDELTNLLEENLAEVSRLLGKGRKTKGDAFPSYWRTAIEDSDQDRSKEELPHLLVPALRQALESGLLCAPKRVLSRCENYIRGDLSVHTIFVRMAIHIAGRAQGKTWRPFQKKTLTEPKFIADDNWYLQTHHEMYHFLKQVFPSLPRNDRDRALKRLASNLGKIEDDKKRISPEHRWLHAAEKGLDDFPEWKARLVELNKIHPLGEKPDFMMYVGETRAISMESEVKPEDLRDMDDDSILRLIQNPPSIKDDLFDDADQRKRALGRDIQEAVKIDPKRFIGLGDNLLRLDESWPALYWVEGYAAAFESLDWNLLDRLIGWGWELAKKQDPSPLDTSRDRNLDVFYWAGAYCAFLRLLDQIVKRRRDDLTEGRLTKIRDLIIALTKAGTADRDPDWVKTPARKVLLDYDPMHDAINTAAGVGVQALMDYVVVRMGNKYPGQKPPYPSDAIEPEVLSALEGFLDDPRPYMRCVIGSSFENLCALKPEWARERISRIFPKDNQELWLGGMTGFLLGGQPIGGCIEELKSHYALAVDILPSLKEGKERLHGDPFDGLARHLMISYLRGCLSLEAGGILQKFFQTAPLEYREEAISFFAGVLRGQGDLVKKNADWWPRMKSLWAERVSQAKASKNGVRELRAFARWLEGLPEPLEAVSPLLKDSAPSFDNWHIKELFEYLGSNVESFGTHCMTVLKSTALGNTEFPVAGVFWHDADLFSLMEKMAAHDPLRTADDFKEIVGEIVRIKAKVGDSDGAQRYRQLLESPSGAPLAM